MYIKVSFEIIWSWQLYELDICARIKSLSTVTIDQLIMYSILQFNRHNICTTVITATIMLISGHLDRIYILKSRCSSNIPDDHIPSCNYVNLIKINK